MSATEQTIMDAKSLTQCIAQMGDLIEDLVEKLSDNEYLNLMNTMKAIYDKQNSNPIIIQAEAQSRMRVRRAKLSTEQKLQDKSTYCVCELCDRVVRKDGLREHQRSKVCLNTYTSKMVAAKEKTAGAGEKKVKFNHIYAEMLTRRAGEDGGTNQLNKYTKASKARVMEKMFNIQSCDPTEQALFSDSRDQYYPVYFTFRNHDLSGAEPAMKYDTVPWKNEPTKMVVGGMFYRYYLVPINHHGEYLWENSFLLDQGLDDIHESQLYVS